MRIIPNDFKAQWQDIRADVITALDAVGHSGHWILGDYVKKTEGYLSRHYFSGLDVIGLGNGLNALEIGLQILGIKPGDQVLTTPLSAFATTLAILRHGGIPVYVDCDKNGQVDLDLADQWLSKNPECRFFLPVHLYGNPLNLSKLESIKKKHDVRILEDCAQAIGARYEGKPVGTVGDIAALSFYPTKNLGALGDAGALVVRGESTAAARCLRDYGQSEKYVHVQIGFNSRLDELHAAIIHDALLPRLAGFTEKRVRNAGLYYNFFQDFDLTKDFRLLEIPDSASPCWHLFPVFLNEGIDRTHFTSWMRERGVLINVHYPLLLPDQPLMKDFKYVCEGTLPNARSIAKNEVSLPIHPYLDEDQLREIAMLTSEYLRNP